VDGGLGRSVAPEESNFKGIGRAISRAVPKAKLTVVDASAEAQQLQESIGDEARGLAGADLVLFIVTRWEFVPGHDERPGKKKSKMRVWMDDWARRTISVWQAILSRPRAEAVKEP